MLSSCSSIVIDNTLSHRAVVMTPLLSVKNFKCYSCAVVGAVVLNDDIEGILTRRGCGHLNWVFLKTGL